MVLYRLVLSLAALWLRLNARIRPGAGAERLSPPPPADRPALWVHGASNGELTAARAAIEALVATGHSLIITTNSQTGRAMVAAWALPGTTVRLAPFDDRATVRRFLDAARPAALIIIENELWPERILAAAARGIPVLVLGARLSDRSARAWGRFAHLARRVLGAITWLAPQDAASRDRFLGAGLPPDRLGPVLSLKSTAAAAPPAAPAPPAPLALPWPRDLTLLAASTHEGEDEPILDAWLAARARHPGLGLILAPRHPRRSAAIAGLIAARGLGFATRSKGEAPGPGTDVYLADTLGEMALWYEAAGMCFVGGSLVDRGGHTPFEPAAYGTAILHGPHFGNFTPAYDRLRAAHAAVAVADEAALGAALIRLAGDGATQARLAAAAAPALAALAPKDGLQPFFTALCSALRQSPVTCR